MGNSGQWFIPSLILFVFYGESSATLPWPARYSPGYHSPLSRVVQEAFVVNFELGFFACQINSSSDFLEVYGLSRLCDGVPDCFKGTDENRNFVPCSGECSPQCAHGVCLIAATVSECFCDDGYTGCDCNTPAVNECKLRPCDLFAKCTNTHDSYYCTCLPGFTGDGASCADIDECANPQKASACVANSECCNTPGSYLCKCSSGFRGDGFDKCFDINECEEGNPCPSDALCANTPGSFQCVCRPGYSYDALLRKCVDVDECANFVCAAGAQCRNLDGHFSCECPDGFSNAYDAKGTCVHAPPITARNMSLPGSDCQCGPKAICMAQLSRNVCVCPPGTTGDPSIACFSVSLPCDPVFCNQNAQCQGNQCICAPGFQGFPPNCQDVDECADRPCAANAVCSNTLGSYKCRCPETLRAVNPYNHNDACLGACDQKKCGKNSVCVERQPGVGFCQCPVGFTGVAEIQCFEVQCPQSPETLCGPNSVCQATSGRLQCSCLPGFMGSPPDSICLDVDECLSNPCAQGAICANTQGSFTCSCPKNSVVRNAYNRNSACKACPPGTVQVSSDECSARDQCALLNPCSPHGHCLNTVDGYVCQCDPGFAAVNGGCAELDKCTPSPCAKGANCINAAGSYMCTCPAGKAVANVYDTKDACRDITGNPCEIFPCYAQQTCTSDAGSDSCYCLEGFDGSPNTACVQVQMISQRKSNALSALQSAPNVVCLYDQCECAPGFIGRPPNCAAMDECAMNPCAPGSCKASEQGGYSCSCPAGYEGLYGRCVSFNQCARTISPCSAGSCVPTPGSFKCICPKNYRLDPIGDCQLDNKCADNPQVCSPGSCISQLGTYRCECPQGYQFSGGTCSDVDECLYNPCSPGSCSNLPGSYSCACPKGYSQTNGECVAQDICLVNPCGPGVCAKNGAQYQCACMSGYSFDGSTCLDVNECAQIAGLCQPGSCLNTNGSFFCQCSPGYSFQNGGCQDIDECAVADPCGPASTACQNSVGSYSCSCKAGYQFNGITCADIDECALSAGLCSPGSCRNAEGSYPCVCPSGYHFATGGCVDVNECDSRPCATYAACINTFGSYECRCPPQLGFGNAFDRNDICQRENVCASHECPLDSDCVPDSGAARCVCPSGFIGQPGACRAVGCTLTDCGPFAECLAVPEGGLACICRTGFRLQSQPSNTTCVDINECIETPSLCTNGGCVNTLGSYECQCSPGYQFDGQSCIDVDECLDFNSCGNVPGSLCVNTVGSFLCRCPSGSIRTNDQCQTQHLCGMKGICGTGQCLDVPGGGYRCICPEGYTSSNGTCLPANPCIFGNPCGSGGTCQDANGRYSCLCPKGYAFDGTTCSDIDECIRSPCGVGGRECVNSQGSYSCICQAGYNFNGKTCEDVNECMVKPSPCSPGQCINLPGSFACSCPTNYDLMNGQECKRIDRCLYNPCMIGTCVEDFVGGYTCLCPAGYQFTKNGVCEDINECTISPNLCQPGACVNTAGSYKCRCPNGFRSSSAGCIPIQHCDLPGICGVGVPKTKCVDLPYGMFQCYCPVGYQAQLGAPCIEMDHCASNPCSPGICSNRLGSYVCTCPRGYQFDNGHCSAVGCDAITCQENARCSKSIRGSLVCDCLPGYKDRGDGHCYALDLCAGRKRNPCGETGQCLPYAGGYACQCPRGWQSVGQPAQCVDIDECALFSPCLVGECVNSKGNYSCNCPKGYRFVDGHCIDVDECAELNGPCKPGSCHNLDGSYECVCPPGYKTQSGTCVDIQECAPGAFNPCSPGQCQDLPGSYKCACPPGYTFRNGNCTANDQCLPVNPCRHGVCRSNPGSYSCDCYPGFALQGGQCQDIDECAKDSSPCVVGKCINTDGAFSCLCPSGYIFNGKFCEDRNECQEYAGAVCAAGGATCLNQPGTYRCVCPLKSVYFDGRCISSSVCQQTRCAPLALPCKDSSDGPVCACPPGYYGDGRISCAAPPPCIAARDCGPNAECTLQISGSDFRVGCRCKAGYEGDPPTRPCDIICPVGLIRDEVTGMCSRSIECIQTSCSPGVCQQSGSDQLTPPCLCPPGTRYLWDRGVCAIIPPLCTPNPCLPGNCSSSGSSYSCNCPLGYRSLQGTCTDVNECLENPAICGAGGICTNTPGAFACQCRSGFQLRDNHCYEIDFCAASGSNPCGPGTCQQTPGGYRCDCLPGFRFMPTLGTCTRIMTPCIQRSDLCGPGQCEALGESNYKCSCPLGFTFNGITCIEINHCAQNPCGRGQCRNLATSYQCTCPPGYRNTGQSCAEIDECALSNPCGVGACQNTDGSYLCICPLGFQFDQITCTDVNECTSKNAPYCGLGQCENTVGSYVCKCPPGTRNAGGPGSLCADIQECIDNPQPCHPGQCVESVGGYQCNCPENFQFINGACQQINFCVMERCNPGSCSVTADSYSCKCPPGYTSTSNPAQDCIQINECALSPAPCGPGAVSCVDTLGSYQCLCGPGYRLSDNKKLCVDIDECASSPNPCNSGQCINTQGSFQCQCPMGYTNTSTAVATPTCSPVNECAGPINPCNPGSCVDLSGGYVCNCPAGYRFKSGGCVDIDECAELSPCQHGVCINTPGNHTCRCDSGFELVSASCVNTSKCAGNPCADKALCLEFPGGFSCTCPPGLVSSDPKTQPCHPIPKNVCETFGCYREGTCRTITRVIDSQGHTLDSCECIENFFGNVSSGSCKRTTEATCAKGFQSAQNGSQIMCTKINECAGNANLCLNGRCVEDIGAYTCECNKGYASVRQANGEVLCIDVNECEASQPCGRGACRNVPGSYVCQCFDGYRSVDGKNCTEIRACKEKAPCGPGTCVDTSPGKYSCRCSPGFSFDGTTCTDVNECLSTQNPCVVGDCINTIGSYACKCPGGYSLSNTSSKCVDINECLIGSPCGPGECRNTDGSYYCVCPPGFERKEPGTCVDINECLQSNPCGDARGLCVNTLGSYQCQCLPGFKFDSAARTCVKTSECAIPAVAAYCLPGTCQDTSTSYRCICPSGFDNSSTPAPACADINECQRNTQLCSPGKCLNTVGSYQCVCPAGYTSASGGCIDVNECLEKTICGLGTCTNTMGSYECACPSGYRSNQLTCVDVDECADKDICSKGDCTNTLGSFLCSCQPGFEPGPKTSCVDINECLRNPAICGAGTCNNTIGSYACQCPKGYHPQEGTCFAINQCEAPGLCGRGSCVNMIGSYSCQCPAGMVFSHGTCVDRDECAANPCPPGSVCQNVPGSFQCVATARSSLVTTCVQSNPCQLGTCVDIGMNKYECNCPAGYHFDGKTCVDINECVLKSDVCSPGACVSLPGTYLCICPPGYQSLNGLCVDINECLQQSICGAGNCENTLGSYQCTCPSGYVTSGGTCVQITECSDQSLCGPGNACQNVSGAYQCVCATGFRFDGVKCVSLDACSVRADICGTGVCQSTLGSYRCNCPTGYEETNGTCGDIDECLYNGICGSGICRNEPGSYDCSCPKGYRFEKNTCTDVNECLEKPNMCSPGTCQNMPGSFQCVCPPGYQFINGTCSDIDECVGLSKPCPKSICINVPGSYRCECPSGYTLDMASQTCQKQCAAGYILVEEHCQPLQTTTAKPAPIPAVTCAVQECGPFATFNRSPNVCGCVCLYGGIPPTCLPLAGTLPVNPLLTTSTKPTIATRQRFPAIVTTTSWQSDMGGDLPEASVNCLSDGIESQVYVPRAFQGVIYVKGYNRDDECRKLVNSTGGQDMVRFLIQYGTCGVSPDGDVAEFVLVIQSHPILVTVDTTAYNIRCRYQQSVSSVTNPTTRTLANKLIPKIGAFNKMIGNEAPAPICRLVIVDMYGDGVTSANIGENLQLKVEVTPFTVYRGFASNCYAVAVDNSWNFQITDTYGCSTDRTIFSEWLEDDDYSLRGNFSAFKFPGASFVRFKCNIRICFGKCPPVVCQPGDVLSLGRRKRQVDFDVPLLETTSTATITLAPVNVVDEVQVESYGLQTYEALPKNSAAAGFMNDTARSVLLAATARNSDICLSTASFAITIAITLLLTLIAIAVAVICFLIDRKKLFLPDVVESSYARPSRQNSTRTSYTNVTRSTGQGTLRSGKSDQSVSVRNSRRNHLKYLEDIVQQTDFPAVPRTTRPAESRSRSRRKREETVQKAKRVERSPPKSGHGTVKSAHGTVRSERNRDRSLSKGRDVEPKETRDERKRKTKPVAGEGKMYTAGSGREKNIPRVTIPRRDPHAAVVTSTKSLYYRSD